jgi:hypothetical protein
VPVNIVDEGIDYKLSIYPFMKFIQQKQPVDAQAVFVVYE